MKISKMNTAQRFILGLLGVFSLVIILYTVNHELLLMLRSTGLVELKTLPATSTTQSGYTPLEAMAFSTEPLKIKDLAPVMSEAASFIISLVSLIFFILLLRWCCFASLNYLYKMEGFTPPFPNLLKTITKEFCSLLFFAALLIGPLQATQLINFFFPNIFHFFQ